MEPNTTARKFRTEIEGLRAVAALLVAIYHIWLGSVSGGVDVFFVIAGFLITTSLINRYQKNNKINFIAHITNLAKRLLPAALTVLFVGSIACILWLNELRWSQTLKEVIASAVYMENWKLARSSVDYLAQRNESSPFQHFWAMSVQGQFYIIWPILLFVAVWFARKIFKKSVRSVFFSLLIVVFISSLSYSVYLTNVNQPWAYFDTFTRMWEFSLGGIVALLISKVVLRKSISLIAGWFGLLGLISCGLILNVSTSFPGYVALWPTLCAVLILFSGNQGGAFGVHRLLSSKPLVRLGGISYGFYLWHWPLLIFYYILSDKEVVGLFEGIMIIVLALVLSYLTTTYIEKPIRNSKNFKLRSKQGYALMSLAGSVVIIVVSWYGVIRHLSSEVVVLAESEHFPGAEVMITNQGDFENSSSYIPRLISVRNDVAKVYEDGCHQQPGKSEVLECIYGEVKEPLYSIAIVGGSHSAQWLPALEEFAEEEKIKIYNYTKSGCRFTLSDAEEDCLKWNENLLDILSIKDPDLVFTTADTGENLTPDIPSGFIEMWEKLKQEGIKVFAIRDNPWFGFDVPLCVGDNGPNSKECSKKREEVVLAESPWSKLENPPENVHYADFTDLICGKEYCDAVIGNVLVYRDYNHLSATYVRSIAPFLRKEIDKALE